MATTTTNFGWSKPEPFSATDEDLWGGILNTTIDSIDSEMASTDKIGKKAWPVPGTAFTPTVTAGASGSVPAETTAGRPDIRGVSFPAGSDTSAEIQIPMPESWDEGTFTFRVYWTTTSTNTGTVSWGVQAVAVGDDDSIDATYGTEITVTDNGLGVSEDMHITSESSAVTAAGTPAAGDILFLKLERKGASDTHTGTAILSAMKIYFVTDGRNDV